VLGVISVLTSLNNSCQNHPMNRGSLSLKIFCRDPCNQNTSLKKRLATCIVEYQEGMVNKCEEFVSLSMTT
jgi:hypothetical protein